MSMKQDRSEDSTNYEKLTCCLPEFHNSYKTKTFGKKYMQPSVFLYPSFQKIYWVTQGILASNSWHGTRVKAKQTEIYKYQA